MKRKLTDADAGNKQSPSTPKKSRVNARSSAQSTPAASKRDAKNGVTIEDGRLDRKGSLDEDEEQDEERQGEPFTPSKKRGRPRKHASTAIADGLRSAHHADPRNEEDGMQPPVTPGRARGRPRKDRTKRTPSPENLPPHEHYFFQNRPGGSKTSDHTLSSLSLLSHEEYFQAIGRYQDTHQEERLFLQELHRKSFSQWEFELQEGFNVCLFGWGSKRGLLTAFAEYLLYETDDEEQQIVIVNGFAQGITIRDVLTAIASAIPSLSNQKLGAQPSDMYGRISAALSDHAKPIMLVVHSIDAKGLRRGVAQTILASLAALQNIRLIASADSPNYPLLWDSIMTSRFNFAHHDTTTFESFDAELGADEGGVVDSVNALLGRFGRAIGGKEGVIYVLKSLTENARRLYALLIAELLSISDNGGDDIGTIGQDGRDNEQDQDLEDDVEGNENQIQSAWSSTASKAGGLEYNTFYRKAMSQLIATNEVAFRTLLKEFYDHQMLMSRRDALGTEYLNVPFRREECEAILEDLVVE